MARELSPITQDVLARLVGSGARPPSKIPGYLFKKEVVWEDADQTIPKRDPKTGEVVMRRTNELAYPSTPKVTWRREVVTKGGIKYELLVKTDHKGEGVIRFFEQKGGSRTPAAEMPVKGYRDAEEKLDLIVAAIGNETTIAAQHRDIGRHGAAGKVVSASQQASQPDAPGTIDPRSMLQRALAHGKPLGQGGYKPLTASERTEAERQLAALDRLEEERQSRQIPVSTSEQLRVSREAAEARYQSALRAWYAQRAEAQRVSQETGKSVSFGPPPSRADYAE